MQNGTVGSRSTPWSLKDKAKAGLRLLNVWPGKHRFYCRGRCIAGPKEDLCSQFCVLFQTLIVVGVYFGVCAAPLAERASIWLPITFAFVVLVTVTFYFLTHCTDPGNIPRRQFLEADLASNSKIDPVFRKALLIGECKPIVEDAELGPLDNRPTKKALRNTRSAGSYHDEGNITISHSPRQI